MSQDSPLPGAIDTDGLDAAATVHRLRARLGITQARLAELMGVSFATVNRWENGQSRPSPLAWKQILRAEKHGLDALNKGFVEPTAVPSAVGATDFAADPEVVRLVAEAERLSFGHLFNPAFATETSLIDPLPHQRIAVYQHMLTQNPLRFLMADDAGAGKTIMAGLYIREMLARRLIRRVLVIPPAGLVGNWQRELRKLFSLPFREVKGSDVRLGNPFMGESSDRIIVSLDTLTGERVFGRLQPPEVLPYDLVVFDEAHKLSANREPDLTITKTDRYRLAEALAGLSDDDPRWRLEWKAHHLLLLTATPHMGRDFPYYCLWRLLQPEALAAYEAFATLPAAARRSHFIRRTKEEMLRLDGTPLYPTRTSDTFSYELTQGEVSEQALYDETTRYIRGYYNRARILNRSAARLAMSVFQRRLASSTYALLRSFDRRIEKLEGLIADLRAGRLTLEQLTLFQRRLDRVGDPFEEKTADDEGAADGREENEIAQDQALGGVLAVSLGELEAERREVLRLRDLARRVYDRGEESKFEKLTELLRDPRYKGDKLILFTEHRDTLNLLVRKLEGLGFTGQVAHIHGGMGHEERDEQVEFFRRPSANDGATYLVATDAAGEGINLQFCWLMVNYDIPWNPARLEQRMGRIHRYGQRHDPVVILNLVAGKTREGRVLKTLLDKLDKIRRQLGSDKVFDVVGRLFQDVSIKAYMEQALVEGDESRATERIEGLLTEEQVQALRARERQLYGDGGDVRPHLAKLNAEIGEEELRRFIPGYVRQFVQRAAPLLGAGVDGDLDGCFQLQPLKTGALDWLWPVLETYPQALRRRLTVYRPLGGDDVVFLHPGEPLFEGLREAVLTRFGADALRGGIFVDPTASQPYLFHLALVRVVRKADPTHRGLAQEEHLESKLVGLKHAADGLIEECPVECLLLLRGGKLVPPHAAFMVPRAAGDRALAAAHLLDRVAQPLADHRRAASEAALPERERFLRRGFEYQEGELAATRARLGEKIRGGDAHAKGELSRIKERQKTLDLRRDEALAALRREPELIAPGAVTFVAHALVVPSSDPEDRKRHDDAVEAVAMNVARAHEEEGGAEVKDVSKPAMARAAGLTDCPGFDLLSRRRDGTTRGIEVKGRAAMGNVELTENEWAKACNLRDRYWLYVVYECASTHPRLLRVQDPFRRLVASPKGGVLITERDILATAEAVMP